MALTKIDDRGLKTPIDLLDNEKIRFGTGNDFEISSGGAGVKLHANNGVFELEGDDVQIWNHAQNEPMAKFTANGSVELYYDNSKKFETTSGGATVTGTLTTTSGINAGNNISLNDSHKIKFGNADDLQIYHDGSSSIISNTTGVLKTHSSHFYVRNAAGDETNIECHPNNAVKLFYDNSKKVETYSNGLKLNAQNNVWIQDNGKLVCGG